MNLLFSQYLYPFVNCLCGLGFIYLYSHSANKNNKELKELISVYNTEIKYLKTENNKNKKNYLENLEYLEKNYDIKISQLKSKTKKLNTNIVSDTLTKNLITIINDENINYEKRVDDCKTLLDLENYVTE